MSRLRFRFAKTGKIRWTSHRDVARMWERAFRRVDLPLAYSAGFSPRPKVSFGLALPTGHESHAEYLDVEVIDDVDDLDGLAAALSGALPAGVAVVAAGLVEPRSASLQEAVVSCTWRWAAVPALAPLGAPAASASPAAADAGRLASAVADLLAADQAIITRNRKGTEVVEDIRPSIDAVRLVAGPAAAGDQPDGAVWLEADLATQPRSIRPIEVLRALDPTLDERSVCRLHQWIMRDGAPTEPLVPTRDPASIAATDAPHVLGRAS